MKLAISLSRTCAVTFLLASGAVWGLDASPGEIDVPLFEGFSPPGNFQPADFAARKAAGLGTAMKAAAAATKDTSSPKVVTVDCTKGKSVQEAIDSNDDPVVIEISGLCHENVLVRRRDGLTIRGTDPQFDGLRGVATDPSPNGVLEIRLSDLVRIENISVNDTPMEGPYAAVHVARSSVNLQNMEIKGNARRAVLITEVSDFDGLGLDISDNGLADTRWSAFQATHGSVAFCIGCRLENNGRWAAISSWGSVVTLLQSVVGGPQGIIANLDSYIDIDCYSSRDAYPQFPECSMYVGSWAIVAQWRSEAVLYVAGPSGGSVWASDHSKAWLFGASQVEAPRTNRIWDTSELKVGSFNAGEEFFLAELAGETRLNGFARALFEDQASLNGALYCDDASDAWADGTTAYAEGSVVAGCEHMAVPAP